MIDAQRKQLLWVAGAAGLSVGTVLLLRNLWKRYQYWNSELVKAGTVKELYIFPLKSGKGTKVDWLDCDIHGPIHEELKDRHLMIVDAKQKYTVLTARQYPKLVLLEANVEGGVLTITDPNGKSVSVDLTSVVKRKQIVRANVFHEQKEEGLECGDEVSNFFHEFLNISEKRDIRLLYFIEGLYTERNVVTQSNFMNNPVPKLTDYAAFHDQATYHMLTQGSIDELNSRLQEHDPPKEVQGLNFRPNVLVEGTPAFDEDKWLEVHIGDAEFLCYQPCTRCVEPNVDPDSGEMDEHVQPLKKLREYRLTPEGKMRQLYTKDPAFGVYLALKKPGRIQAGDEVFVRYKPTPF